MRFFGQWFCRSAKLSGNLRRLCSPPERLDRLNRTSDERGALLSPCRLSKRPVNKVQWMRRQTQGSAGRSRRKSDSSLSARLRTSGLLRFLKNPVRPAAALVDRLALLPDDFRKEPIAFDFQIFRKPRSANTSRPAPPATDNAPEDAPTRRQKPLRKRLTSFPPNQSGEPRPRAKRTSEELLPETRRPLCAPRVGVPSSRQSRNGRLLPLFLQTAEASNSTYCRRNRRRSPAPTPANPDPMSNSVPGSGTAVG